jgi:hypothetical protein
MQIVRTDIAQATAVSGEPVVRVQFRGEGGECITVDMAAGEAEQYESDDAVTRARVLLVQTGSFGLAANDYEAQSNGNFDEIAVTTVQDGADKLYIFEYRDGDGARKVPPASMPSVEAAREEAVRGAIDLLADLQPTGHDPSAWLVRVWGETGELVCAIDVQEAEAAQQASQ